MGDPVTSTLAIASIGLNAAGKGMQAEGTAAADEFKAQQMEEAATYGELKANQTNAQMTRNLVMTLGNIDAVRGAAHIDPTSPTGSAVREAVEEQGTMEKNIKVDSIAQQARMDEAGAQYMRQASSDALLAGDIGIAGSFIGGLPGAMKGGGFGWPGTPSGTS